MVAEQRVGTSTSGAFRRGLTWVVLVVIVPVLFAAVLLCGALQVLGIPVVHDAMRVFGFVHAQPMKTETSVTAVNQLRMERIRYRQLQATNQSIRTKLSTSQNKVRSLQDNVARLRTQLSHRTTLAAAAKMEAQVLAAMDPNQAAAVVGKMTLSQSALVMGAMSTSDSGPILAAMDPSLAAKVIVQASLDKPR